MNRIRPNQHRSASALRYDQPTTMEALLFGTTIRASLVILSISVCAVLTLPLRAWYPATAVFACLAGIVLAKKLVPISKGGSGGSFPVLAVWGAAVLSTIWLGLTHSENVVVNRDASSYLQSAIALAGQHGTPLDNSLSVFEGVLRIDPDRITLSSLAFYQVSWPFDFAVQPQFLPGATSIYSIGIWIAGFTGAVWVGAIFGGLNGLITDEGVGGCSARRAG